MKQEILLSITMLVSNREDTIEKCLESLQSLRNAVPSELIIVDTAGNEKCMEIVHKYTDNIERFQWCDDFSAARNVGVRKAIGQWLMFLDDDEWFENTKELEHFFVSEEYRKYNSAAYLVRNYTNSEGTKWNETVATRLVKRENETCFRDKIHEYLYPLKKPVCYLKDYVHHYGYAYKSNQERLDHCRRNIKLLLELRKKQPNDYRVVAQLLQEYTIASEYFTAVELAKEVRAANDCWGKWEKYTNYIIATEMKLYYRMQRYEEGYQIGQKLLKDYKVSRFLKGYLVNIMVEFCYRLERYQEALQFIEQFPRVLEEWEKYPDKEDVDCFNIIGGVLVPEEIGHLLLLKLRILVLQEKWEEAEETLLEVDWKDRELHTMLITGKDVVNTLRKVEFHQEYASALEAVVANQNLAASVYELVEKETESAVKEKLLKYFSQLPAEDEMVCKYHLMYAGLQGKEVLAKCALEKLREKHCSFFLPDKLYWESLQKLGVNINSYMDEVSIYEWMEMSKRLWVLLDEETSESAYLCLVKGLEKSDIRFLHVSALWMEKRLLDRDLEVMKAEEIWNGMYMVAQYWVSCAATLYKESIFMGNLIEAIPPAYRFGWYILQAKSVEESNTSAYIRKLADAAKAYPVMKELCKKVMRAAADE